MKASTPLWPTPEPGPDGMIPIAISNSTRRRIKRSALKGESINATLTRVLDVAAPAAPKVWTMTAGIDMSEKKIELAQNTMATALKALAPEKRPDVVKKIMERFAGEGSEVAQMALGALKPDAQERLAVALDGKVEVPDIARTALPFVMEACDGVQAEVKDTRSKLDRVLAAREALPTLRALNTAPVLQQLGESCWYKCAAAYANGSILIPFLTDGNPLTLKPDELVFDGAGAQVFVVQHNWAAAFAKAEGFDDGEYRLPYEAAVFEFRFSGFRTCISITAPGHIPESAMLNVETKNGWVLGGIYRHAHGAWETVKPTVEDMLGNVMAEAGRQIKAICVALGAEVAVTEVVRAPHQLNVARAKRGKPPLLDFRTVSLAERKRYAPRPLADGEEREPGTRKRLHFRRGHDRHYPTYKVWIEWMLVGDPELGFIDKHYRL